MLLSSCYIPAGLFTRYIFARLPWQRGIYCDIFDDAWLEESQTHNFEEPSTNATAGNNEEDAKGIRQALVDFVHSNPLSS